jgi:hypothetical protein
MSAPVAVDHFFVCCAAGAPEAEALTQRGLREGSSNTHPGQGTANRRFFFENLYLEVREGPDLLSSCAGSRRHGD